MSESTVTLDVREEIRGGGDPFTRIMGAVGELKPSQRLRVIAPFKPVPLLAVMARKGFSHQAEPLGTDGNWQVLFERRPLTTGTEPTPEGPAKPAEDGAAAQVREVDARGLEPPEPMIRILEAAESLPFGATLRARTDRQPIHLFPHLEFRGLAGSSEPQEDGSYVTTIRRLAPGQQ